jgi:type I restriction enzyme M protein
MKFEEFKDCLAWWENREENERAWKVPATDIRSNGCNLDRKNPHTKEDIAHLPPLQLAESILSKERQLAELISNIKALLGGQSE